jgi:5-oxoprolinase (ATP-hydrolysing) subunit A
VTVTVNSDMGESFGLHSFGNDDGLLPLIDAANVACGFHAGDPATMQQTVLAALEAGILVGAHPGLPDLVGFGRREMKLDADEVRDLVRYQVGALTAFLGGAGGTLNHIKPHGSLYGMVARDDALMAAVCDVAEQYETAVYGIAGTAHERVANERKLPFVAEFYVDLDYDADGKLIIPKRAPATDPEVAAERTTRALTEGVGVAQTGERFNVRVETICIHSDRANAIDVAAAVRRAIDEA